MLEQEIEENSTVFEAAKWQDETTVIAEWFKNGGSFWKPYWNDRRSWTTGMNNAE